jgi:DUF4097 and DUF4098 domain-containing protein YvlB
VQFGETTPASTTVTNDGAGSVSVQGAAGAIAVTTSTGDIELGIASWSPEDGNVFADNGDITLTVPASVDGTMVFSASGDITEQGVPETWASSGAGSYTMNSGSGGQLTVTADFGDIALVVQ